MSRRVKVYASPKLAAEACGRSILSVASKAVRERGLANIAVSGGSTPRLMFDFMARRRFDWSAIHLFWVDERAVPPSDPESNYKLAFETLIEPAGIPATNVHRVQAELPPADAARLYVIDIQDHFHLAPRELPQFDVIHLGIGPDVHTASMFPGEPLIYDRENVAAPVYVEKLNSWRISLLPGVLTAARHTAVLAAGADKSLPVQTALYGVHDPIRFPAQIVMGPGLAAEWFLDKEAAAQVR